MSQPIFRPVKKILTPLSLTLMIGSLALPSLAKSPPLTDSMFTPEKTPLMAQTNHLCRQVAVKSGLIIREQPNSNSGVVSAVPFNAKIALTSGTTINGSDGRLWVEIATPVKGFISTGYPNAQSNLGLCDSQITNPNNPPPNPVNLCRQVEGRVAPNGIVIRSDASRNSTQVGSVPVGGKVTLIANYTGIKDKNGEKRTWVQITHPQPGFISTGTLIMCK